MIPEVRVSIAEAVAIVVLAVPMYLFFKWLIGF